MPALRCLGNMLTINDTDVIDKALFHGCLDKLTSVLFTTNSNLIKECCWALSNITAGPPAHIEKFIESQAFARIKQLTLSYNLDHRKESLWVLCNAITGSDVILKERILKDNDYEVITILTKAMNLNELKLLMNVLEALEELLKLDKIYGWHKTDRSVAYAFETSNGLEALETLQKHPNISIYNKVVHIITTYMDTDDDNVMGMDVPN